jgi:Sulfotransferase domain.
VDLQMRSGKYRPDFFIVGAAKCGTTSLANYLAQHTDIYIPALKEPKFFSIADNRFPHNGPGDTVSDAKVIKVQSDYESLFLPGENYAAKGEASVDYLYFEGVPERIKRYNPSAKIIIVLRNPAKRAFSNYIHMVRDQREMLSFEDALENEEKRKAKNWEFFWLYKELGFYSSQVERYVRCFGPNQVHVVLFEEINKDPIKVVQDLYLALGVDSDFKPDVSPRFNISGIPEKKWLHSLLNRQNLLKTLVTPLLPVTFRKNLRKKISDSNLKKSEIDPVTYKKLLNLYQRDIVRLQTLIKKDVTGWLE